MRINLLEIDVAQSIEMRNYYSHWTQLGDQLSVRIDDLAKQCEQWQTQAIERIGDLEMYTDVQLEDRSQSMVEILTWLMPRVKDLEQVTQRPSPENESDVKFFDVDEEGDQVVQEQVNADYPPPSKVVDEEVEQVVPVQGIGEYPLPSNDFDVVKPRRGRAKAKGRR